MREYNDRSVYDCLNNLFLVYGGITALNIPTTPINDISHLNKRTQYTYDNISAASYFISENTVSTVTAPSDYPQFIFLNSDVIDNQHTIMSDNPFHVSTKILYCYRFYDGKICHKN